MPKVGVAGRRVQQRAAQHVCGPGVQDQSAYPSEVRKTHLHRRAHSREIGVAGRLSSTAQDAFVGSAGYLPV